MSDWHYGVITTLLIFPLWATWLFDNKIKLFQRGILEPFMVAFLGSIGVFIGTIISKSWNVWDSILATSFGLALLVMIIKGIRGTLSVKEEDDYISVNINPHLDSIT